jgi:hypothetical protein
LEPLTSVAIFIQQPPRLTRLTEADYGWLAVELDSQKILLQVKEIVTAGKTEEATD